ncbi:zf-HC2 domain-containing protein [Planobispora siamensis]|nr:zf-HC2 domain-containing protein [Planobispora siamensis]
MDASQSDAELLAAIRGGNAAAYVGLYERHAAAARTLARQLVLSPAVSEDVVAETFTRILDLIRRGGGPDEAFRPYLLSALRRTVYERGRTDTGHGGGTEIELFDPGVPFVDPALTGLERSLVARAFLSLPERWQLVLWHTEVERARAAEVALLLGLPVDSVEALAYQALEGMRQACLRTHMAETPRQGCRSVVAKMGAYVRGGLTKRESRTVDRHVEGCADCRVIFMELSDVSQGLRVIVGPLIAGSVLGGYLAALGKADHTGGFLGGVIGWGREPGRGRQAAAVCGAVVALAMAVVLVLITVADPAVLTRSRSSTPIPAPIVAQPESGSAEPPAPPQKTGAQETRPTEAAPSGTGPSGTGPSGAEPSGTPPQPTASATASPPIRWRSRVGLPPLPPSSPAPLLPAPPAPLLLAGLDTLGALVRSESGMLAVRLRNAGTAGSAPLVAWIGLPSGVTMAPVVRRAHATVSGGAVGTVDGWSCRAVRTGARCARGPLGPGRSTTVFLRVLVSSRAREGAVPSVRITGAGRVITATAASGVRSAGAPARFAADGRVTTAAIGNTLVAPRSSSVIRAQAQATADLTCGDVPGEGGDEAPGAPRAQRPAAGPQPLDRDGDPTTRSSSAARLALPRRSRIVWAGLYWSSGAPAGPVKFKVPGAQEYTRIRAARTLEQDLPEGRAYQSFADVTRLVRGLRGRYWVADVPAGSGAVRHAGWSLVVVAADPRRPYGRAVVVDTFTAVGRGRPARIPLDGLVASPVPARVDLVAWGGEAGVRGDRVRVGRGVPLRPESGGREPGDVFDGSATGALGTVLTSGVDVDGFRVALGRRPVLRVSGGRDAILFGVAVVNVQARS